MVDSYQGVGGGDRGWVLSHSFLVFLLVLLPFVLLRPVLFFKLVEHGSCCVCFFCLLFVFFVSGSFN